MLDIRLYIKRHILSGVLYDKFMVEIDRKVVYTKDYVNGEMGMVEYIKEFFEEFTLETLYTYKVNTNQQSTTHIPERYICDDTIY